MKGSTGRGQLGNLFLECSDFQLFLENKIVIIVSMRESGQQEWEREGAQYVAKKILCESLANCS